jgi:peptide/nickel transport system substrate-binding protein
MRRTYLIFLVLIAMLALTVGGCKSRAKEIQQQAMHVAAMAAPITFNPVFIRDAISAEVSGLLHPQLIGTNPETMEVEPRMIESWTISEDNRTYEITLRDNLRWSDGEPITTRDVAFTLRVICHADYTGWMFPLLQYIKGSREFRTARISMHAEGEIAGIRVLDERTLQIELNKPHAPFLSYLTFAPLPYHLLGEIAVEELEMHPYSRTLPVGAGPYLLQEWRQDEYLHVRANPDYYLGEPQIAQVYYRFIANPEAQIIELLAGKLDLIPTAVKVEDIHQLQDDPQIAIHRNKRLVYDYISMNMNKDYSPLKNKKVRMALSMLVDKNELVDDILLGYGTPLNGPLLPLHFAYDPDFSQYEHSLPAARNLLLEAGYPLMELKLIYNAGNIVREHVALLLKEKAAYIGVDIKIQILEWEAFLAAISSGDYDLAILGRGADADPDLSFHWHSQGAGNVMSYSSEKLDELLERGVSLRDREQRGAIYREVQRLIAGDAPIIWLYTREAVHAAGSGLEDFSAHPESLFYNVHQWRLTKRAVNP